MIPTWASRRSSTTPVSRGDRGDRAEASFGSAPRQLKVRTLLLGMLSTAADNRPAHLSRVHASLIKLPPEDRLRLGVVVSSSKGPTCSPIDRSSTRPGSCAPRWKGQARRCRLGTARALQGALLESSVPEECKQLSSSLAVDWSDLESSLTGRQKGASVPTRGLLGTPSCEKPGPKDELFFGYYFSLATMVNDEGEDAVPELVRAMVLSSCHLDPVVSLSRCWSAFVPPGAIGDVLADSGYAHRRAESFALPMRALGASW